MAVYAICTKCGSRRDKCLDVTAHKKSVRWTADVQFTRSSPRIRKTYTTKELADIQERQWRTDHERGTLLPTKTTNEVTFAQVADEWWNNEVIGQSRIRNPNRSEKSRVEMFKTLFKSRLLTSLELSDAERWLNSRIEKGCAVNTINRDMRPLRWIINYALKKKYLLSSPFSSLGDLKGGNIHDRWMTEQEHPLLVQAARDLGDHDLVNVIAIGLNTGFRKGNLQRLSARHIYSDLIEAKQTKSGEPYTVPIPSAIAILLRQLVQEHPTGPLLNMSKIDFRFREAAKKAGLYKDAKDTERVTLHSLRHTFAVLFLERGGDIYDLSNLLGHASVAVTDAMYGRYTRKRKDGQASMMSTPIAGLESVQFKVVD